MGWGLAEGNQGELCFPAKLLITGNLKQIQKQKDQSNDLPNTHHTAAQLSIYGRSCFTYYPPDWIIWKEIPEFQISRHFIYKYFAVHL